MMIRWLVLAIGIALLAWLLLRLRARPPGMAFDLDDPRMAAAKQAARDTLDEFWTALAAGAPGDTDFGLKFDLNHGSGLPDRELIWAMGVTRSDGVIRGTLANPPINRAFRAGDVVDITPEAAGDVVDITPEAIVDWCFFRGDVAHGHHITRLMIDLSAPRDAEAARRQLGW